MRLEHLCDMDFTYRLEPLYDDVFKYVVPYGTQEASLYGEGDAVFRGERLNGTARFVNHARRRSDGVNLPDAHGIIRTDDGAVVLFTMQGRTQPASDGKRRQLLTVLFEADDERYQWLNSAVCVLEGVIRSASSTVNTRIYTTVHELD
jgi:hypothetical protein